MAFGFFKRKGPVEVTCPHCEHRQQEPLQAVSSVCRACQAYWKLENGLVIDSHRQDRPTAEVVEPLASRKQHDPNANGPLPGPDPTSEALKKEKLARIEKQRASLPPLLQDQQTRANPQAFKRRKRTSAITPSDLKPARPAPVPPSPHHPSPPQKETGQTHCKNDEEEKPALVPIREDYTPKQPGPDDRMVLCFECPVEHPVSKNAQTTLCPNCGAYISLKDHGIKTDFNSRIQTRGKVHIYKHGVVTSSLIRCQDLIVEGEFTGGAECAGDLTIRRHSTIGGKVTCQKLIIEKRARVTFEKEVETRSCEIDGRVEGDIHCEGRLALHKKATLQGDIRVGTLSVDEGARHTGKISMGG